MLDVVVYGVTTIASGACRSVKVGRTVVGDPPVCPGFDVIRKPPLVRDVPLRREGKVVITSLGEISLLVPAPINEGDIVEGEGAEWVRVCEVSEHCVRMEAGIANDIRHPCLLPAVELLRVTTLAGLRADELRGSPRILTGDGGYIQTKNSKA